MIPHCCFDLYFSNDDVEHLHVLYFVFGEMSRPSAHFWSGCLVLHGAVQLSQQHLLKRLSFFHCIFLPPLLKINWLRVCEFISGLSILFCWCMSVFVPVPHCFGYCSFVVLFEVWESYTSCSVFLPSIALAVLGLLRFHINFCICSSSGENVMDNLIWISFNLCIALCSIVIYQY